MSVVALISQHGQNEEGAWSLGAECQAEPICLSLNGTVCRFSHKATQNVKHFQVYHQEVAVKWPNKHKFLW